MRELRAATWRGVEARHCLLSASSSPKESYCAGCSSVCVHRRRQKHSENKGNTRQRQETQGSGEKTQGSGEMEEKDSRRRQHGTCRGHKATTGSVPEGQAAALARRPPWAPSHGSPSVTLGCSGVDAGSKIFGYLSGSEFPCKIRSDSISHP